MSVWSCLKRPAVISSIVSTGFLLGIQIRPIGGEFTVGGNYINAPKGVYQAPDGRSAGSCRRLSFGFLHPNAPCRLSRRSNRASWSNPAGRVASRKEGSIRANGNMIDAGNANRVLQMAIPGMKGFRTCAKHVVDGVQRDQPAFPGHSPENLVARVAAAPSFGSSQSTGIGLRKTLYQDTLCSRRRRTRLDTPYG